MNLKCCIIIVATWLIAATVAINSNCDLNWIECPAAGCSWDQTAEAVAVQYSVRGSCGDSSAPGTVYKNVAAGITSQTCSVAAFGTDPCPLLPKTCYYAVGWRFCATDGETCQWPTTNTSVSVQYGRSHCRNFQLGSQAGIIVIDYPAGVDSVQCGAATFGDPCPLVTKGCLWCSKSSPTDAPVQTKKAPDFGVGGMPRPLFVLAIAIAFTIVIALCIWRRVRATRRQRFLRARLAEIAAQNDDSETQMQIQGAAAAQSRRASGYVVTAVPTTDEPATDLAIDTSPS